MRLSFVAPMLLVATLSFAVDDPRVVHLTAPIYPQIAQGARVQGKATVDATISPEGLVTQVLVTSAHPMFKSVVDDHARSLRFDKAGSERKIHLTYNFVLGEACRGGCLCPDFVFDAPATFTIIAPPRVIETNTSGAKPKK